MAKNSTGRRGERSIVVQAGARGTKKGSVSASGSNDSVSGRPRKLRWLAHMAIGRWTPVHKRALMGTFFHLLYIGRRILGGVVIVAVVAAAAGAIATDMLIIVVAV